MQSTPISQSIFRMQNGILMFSHHLPIPGVPPLKLENVVFEGAGVQRVDGGFGYIEGFAQLLSVDLYGPVHVLRKSLVSHVHLPEGRGLIDACAARSDGQDGVLGLGGLINIVQQGVVKPKRVIVWAEYSLDSRSPL